MVPTKLTLRNFTSYGEDTPVLDFTKFHLAAISGSNGAGKSSLLDAITWCLWGSSRAGDSSDELVKLGQEKMEVEFSFLLDSNEFTVKRARIKKSGGSTALEFWGGNHNLTEGTIKATQQKIIDTLHLTYETFTNSSFLRQGRDDEFTTKGPTDRKRILANILGLDHYDQLEEKAKDRAKAALTKLQLNDYKLLEIEAELSQKQNSQAKKDEAEKKISEVEGKINFLERELKDLNEAKAKLLSQTEQQTKLKQTFEELKNELAEILLQGKRRSDYIKDLKTQLLELPSIEKKASELKVLQRRRQEFDTLKQSRLEIEKKFSDVKGKLDLKLSQKKTLEEAQANLDRSLKDLEKEGSKCPTCGQEIDKDHKTKVKKELLEELSKYSRELNGINTSEEQAILDSYQKELDKLQFDDRQYQEITENLTQLEELQLKREGLIKKQATLESEEKTVDEMRALFSSKKAQVDKLETEVKTLIDLSRETERVNTTSEEKETTLAQLRSEEKITRGFLGQVVELISRQDQLLKLQKDLSSQKEQLTQEKESFEELALAFGKKGIQAMIIEQAIPEIEEEANLLLERLSEGRMKVSFDTQRETKTKIVGAEGEKVHGTVETLDIIISDEMGERPYELYSGGEAFRVNLAIRLAISKLLTHRAGAKLQFLILDEGFGTQDAAGRSRLVEVIETIKNDFEKILVITHIEELKEEFPTRIEVTKGAGGSTFEVISE